MGSTSMAHLSTIGLVNTCETDPHHPLLFGFDQRSGHMLLLQPLSWRCAEYAVHHERNVREEQHHIHICGANKQ